MTEVADWAANLPPGSAVARAQNPDEWNLTPETYILREIEHGVRVLAWQNTKDAVSRDPQNIPLPLPLTAAEVETQKPKAEYDATSIEEMNEFLGWSA